MKKFIVIIFLSFISCGRYPTPADIDKVSDNAIRQKSKERLYSRDGNGPDLKKFDKYIKEYEDFLKKKHEFKRDSIINENLYKMKDQNKRLNHLLKISAKN
jgi:hypothetical protein